jgi:uncharacterized protein YbcV (DUF1398 family)
MNARVGSIVGTNGEATLNSNVRKLIGFCTINNLKITNTFFKQKEIHRKTTFRRYEYIWAVGS